MVAGVSLLVDLGPYLLVTWADGVQVEGAGLVAADAEPLAALLETANELAALNYEDAPC